MRSRPVTEFLGQRSKVEVLRCLFGDKDGLSGREIARRCALSHPIVHKTLGDFERQGIVLRRTVPPAHLFRLNENHWFVAGILRGVFEKERDWQDDLEKLIARGAPEGVASLVLFGSLLKGGFRPESDIDLLALVKDADGIEAARAHLDEAGARVYRVFRHPLSSVVMTLRDFGRRCRNGDDFTKDISYTGKVIHGILMTEVLSRYGRKKN